MTGFAFGLEHDFLRVALLAGVLVGGTCAWLGIFLVLRRTVFVGAALAEIAALGLALGLLLASALHWPHERPELVDPLSLGVSFALTLVGILAFWLPWARRDVSRESFVGYAWATAIALTTLVLALNPGGEFHGLDLLSGNLLFLDRGDLSLLLGVLPVIWLVHFVWRRQIACASMDQDTARTLGLPARRLDLLLHLTIGVTIAVSMRAVGVLFVFASLVVPASSGLLATRSLRGAGTFAVIGAAAAVLAGVLGSHAWDLPTGPTVVAAEALLLPLALGVRFLRGG